VFYSAKVVYVLQHPFIYFLNIPATTRG